MKRILSIATVFAAAILAASSCSKAEKDFSGSNGDVTYSMGPYMMCIADNLIVDNLKVLEYRINDKANIQSKASVMTSEDPSYRVPGVKVEKTAQDSTWIVSNENLDYQFIDTSYPTDYTITARMLPGDYNYYHSWEVSIEGARREKDGYSCKFLTNECTLIYTIGDSEISWGCCKGKLTMLVYKDGKIIDTVIMVLRGKYNNISLTRP